MSNWKRRLLGMGLPCLLALALDNTVTLCGQPEEYWAGDYSQINESAPFNRMLFAIHPVAFVAWTAAWAGILSGLILLLPESLAVVLSIAVVFGHTSGAYTWLGGGFTMGWFQTAGGLIPAAAVVLGVGLCWSLSEPGQREATGANRRCHPLVRWSLIAALFGIACYTTFFPH